MTTTKKFVVTLSLVLVTLSALAQRAGQNVSIQYGTIVARERINLNSGAVPRGAVVGGALGLASASGKSKKKKARNALIGAAAGGAIASSSQGSTQGMLYTIDLGSNGMAQVVTDQTEIVQGDCVAFEKAGETANVRRISAAYCNPDNAAAVAAVEDDDIEEADECYAAKQLVVDATTMEEFEFAKAKMSLLCDD
ncbi:MAG: hypothetical protein PVJ95_11770 [Cellvibrionales bacterium]